MDNYPPNISFLVDEKQINHAPDTWCDKCFAYTGKETHVVESMDQEATFCDAHYLEFNQLLERRYTEKQVDEIKKKS